MGSIESKRRRDFAFETLLLERLSRVSTGQALLGMVLACLRERGLNIARARLGLEVQHDTVMAVAWVYESEEGLNEFMVRHDVTTTDQYQLSPVRPVKERQTKELRIRLSDDSLETHFNVEEEYRADGLTDYIVLSLASPRVRDDVVTFATKEVGGFSEKHLLGHWYDYQNREH